MRINKYIAQATGMSRRAADHVIEEGRVRVGGFEAQSGQQITQDDIVTFDGKVLVQQSETITIMLNKPAGFVCSRAGQGSQTIYDLLPERYHSLKSIGRLDKESSGLLLLTNDGELTHRLTHPSFLKTKVYEITLDKPLVPIHHQFVADRGIQLQDGVSKLQLMKLDNAGIEWQVTMHEGRNRQIRRTFQALGYNVQKLHRTQFGEYALRTLASAQVKEL